MEQYNADSESYKNKYETELPALQKKYDDEVAAHATFRTETETAAKNAITDKLYSDLLTKAGLRPDLISNELKLANRELLALDKDGKALKDPEKAIADAKTRFANDFAEEKQGGAGALTGGNTFSKKISPTTITGATENTDMNAWIRGASETAE
jgi:hypothetical protein